MKLVRLKFEIIRYIQITMLIAAFSGLGWGIYRSVVYLRTSPRFEVQKLSVSGLKRVTENQVIAAAGFEVGTNVFKADLDEIRQRVEELDWVRHALVQRVLPDRIVIKVIEREPAGFARIGGELYQFDIDARILGLDPVSENSFPILDGLRHDDAAGNAMKVDAYRRVLEELGATELSEVRINGAGEVSVVSASDPLMVNLGVSDFRSRWIKYLQLKTQIQQQYPDAVRVDLRFKNQVIIRMKDDDTGEMILWGAEKRTL
ncbi:MAG: FtsQ-type POTRA domain-containing protein [Acidobacteria bacterium]|nr:FtsQ-type POTRA domain-containing protein [Acidobacteriota bacterium]